MEIQCFSEFFVRNLEVFGIMIHLLLAYQMKGFLIVFPFKIKLILCFTFIKSKFNWIFLHFHLIKQMDCEHLLLPNNFLALEETF